MHMKFIWIASMFFEGAASVFNDHTCSAIDPFVSSAHSDMTTDLEAVNNDRKRVEALFSLSQVEKHLNGE